MIVHVFKTDVLARKRSERGQPFATLEVARMPCVGTRLAIPGHFVRVVVAVELRAATVTGEGCVSHVVVEYSIFVE